MNVHDNRLRTLYRQYPGWAVPSIYNTWAEANNYQLLTTDQLKRLLEQYFDQPPANEQWLKISTIGNKLNRTDETLRRWMRFNDCPYHKLENPLSTYTLYMVHRTHLLIALYNDAQFLCGVKLNTLWDLLKDQQLASICSSFQRLIRYPGQHKEVIYCHLPTRHLISHPAALKQQKSQYLITSFAASRIESKPNEPVEGVMLARSGEWLRADHLPLLLLRSILDLHPRKSPQDLARAELVTEGQKAAERCRYLLEPLARQGLGPQRIATLLQQQGITPPPGASFNCTTIRRYLKRLELTPSTTSTK